MFLPLLLASLVLLTEETPRRLQELRGRLGVAPPKREVGTRMRLLGIYRRYAGEPWLDQYHRFVYNLWGQEFGEDLNMREAIHRGDHVSVAAIVTAWLPPEGVSSPRLDPFFSWLAGVCAQKARALEEEVRKVGVPNVPFPAYSFGTWLSILQRSFSSLLDRYEAVHPDWSGMSDVQAVAAAKAWHDALAAQVKRGVVSRGVTVVRYTDGAAIDRLVTRTNMDDEGAFMGHCVGGYWESVRDGTRFVFSYRDPAGVPQATWAVTRALDLYDLEGPGNHNVSDPVAARRVLAWLQEHGIELDEFAHKVGYAPSLVVPRALLPEALREERRKKGRWLPDEEAAELEKAYGLARYTTLHEKVIPKSVHMPEYRYMTSDLTRYEEALNEFENQVSWAQEAREEGDALGEVAEHWAYGEELEVFLADATLLEGGLPASTRGPEGAKTRRKKKGEDPGPLTVEQVRAQLTAWGVQPKGGPAVTPPNEAPWPAWRDLLMDATRPGLADAWYLHHLVALVAWEEQRRDLTPRIREMADLGEEEEVGEDDFSTWARNRREGDFDDASREMWDASKALVEALDSLFSSEWSLVYDRDARWDEYAVFNLYGPGRSSSDDVPNARLAFTQGPYGGEADWFASDEQDRYYPSRGSSGKDPVTALYREGLLLLAEDVEEEKKKAEAVDSPVAWALPQEKGLFVILPGEFVAHAHAEGAPVPKAVLKYWE